MLRFPLVALASLILGAALAPAAGAANVTVGPDLDGAFTYVPCGGKSCTYVNTSVSGLGAHAVSPVSGLIVGWQMGGNTAGRQYRLRVMTPLGGDRFDITASGAVETPITAFDASFATALPIAAGQTIGLDTEELAPIGIAYPLLGSASVLWEPLPLDGVTPPPNASTPEAEVAFNAEIQPAPSVAGLDAASGPLAGGTAVTLTGADFRGVTAVTFGTSGATFTVTSETAIAAIAPPAPNPGPVPVTVTSNAGTGSSQTFTYLAPAIPPSPPAPTPTPIAAPAPTCKVPNLKGRTLKTSKQRIRAADCKVGSVSKKPAAPGKGGKVIGQSAKPGTVLPAGSVVKVTLGKVRTHG
jgi:IPT/TIG domain/PASTA domain